MSETPKIVLEGVTKSFGDHHVLQGIDLGVGNGESVVLIGGSASGKTLILKCILGLVTPDAGKSPVFKEMILGAIRYFSTSSRASSLRMSSA